MINIEDVKRALLGKQKENAIFEKKYYLDENNLTVHKISRRPENYVAYLTMMYLMQYYQKEFGLSFKCKFKSKDIMECISPLVSVFMEKDPLSDQETEAFQKILDDIAKEINIIMKSFFKDGCYIRVFSLSTASNNYFWYNNNYYLLDFEEVYFCCYDESGKNIGKDALHDECREFVHEYSYPKDVDRNELNIRDNMLSLSWHVL